VPKLPKWLTREHESHWTNLTERARAAFELAQEEARRMNHSYIGTEHLLLGLLRQESGVAADTLDAGRAPSPGHPLGLEGLGIDLASVRARVEDIVGRGPEPSPAELGVTPRTKRVMELAGEEARRMGHVHIGTEHLLLGILREGEGVAADILVQLGADLPTVRARLDAFFRKDNVVTCRISARDLEAIDVLIEAGIRSTRSDAAAWLIGAGVEANEDLFRRVRATVEEIRRLRDEAKAMAQQSLTKMSKATHTGG